MWLRTGLMAGFYEHGNEILGFIEQKWAADSFLTLRNMYVTD
jgi:hypothetical protein